MEMNVNDNGGSDRGCPTPPRVSVHTGLNHSMDELIFDSICRHLAAMARAGKADSTHNKAHEPFGMMKNLSKMVCDKILERAVLDDDDTGERDDHEGDAARVLAQMRQSASVLAKTEHELRLRFKSVSSAVKAITEHEDTTTDDLQELHEVLTRCQATLQAIQV